MFVEDGKVCFTANNSGGIADGLTTGQPISPGLP